MTPDKAEVKQPKWTRIATDSCCIQFDVLDQDILEILRLIRSWRNTTALINRIPPEILTLIPNFWETHIRDRDLITLTHVCRAWRGVFISQPSLWTDLDWVGLDRTRAYLERSKTCPINVSIYKRRVANQFFCDPPIQIAPHAMERNP